MRIRARLAREITHLPRAIARHWSPSEVGHGTYISSHRRVHEYKEIGYSHDCLELFDLHQHHKNEDWATRVHVTPGDLLAVPANTFYRFTLDQGTMLRLRLCGYPRYVCTTLFYFCESRTRTWLPIFSASPVICDTSSMRFLSRSYPFSFHRVLTSPAFRKHISGHYIPTSDGLVSRIAQVRCYHLSVDPRSTRQMKRSLQKSGTCMYTS